MVATPPLRGRARRASPARVVAAVAAAVVVDVAIDPVHTHVPLCPFHTVTGWWCPLCGSLRAVDELARGHLWLAAHDNLLLVAAVPVLLAIWLAWAAKMLPSGTGVRRSRAVRVGAVVAIVAFTIVRNLPAVAALRPV